MSSDETIREFRSYLGSIKTKKKSASSAENGRKSADKLRGITRSEETKRKMALAQRQRREREKISEKSSDTS
jgi:hypothetical protein